MIAVSLLELKGPPHQRQQRNTIVNPNGTVFRHIWTHFGGIASSVSAAMAAAPAAPAATPGYSTAPAVPASADASVSCGALVFALALVLVAVLALVLVAVLALVLAIAFVFFTSFCRRFVLFTVLAVSVGCPHINFHILHFMTAALAPKDNHVSTYIWFRRYDSSSSSSSSHTSGHDRSSCGPLVAVCLTTGARYRNSE